jgi:hypothetical protein
MILGKQCKPLSVPGRLLSIGGMANCTVSTPLALYDGWQLHDLTTNCHIKTKQGHTDTNPQWTEYVVTDSARLAI